MLITFIRTLILYIITMIAIRLMGKRQIGELEPAELVVTIIISELATMPIQDIDAPLANTVVAICVLVASEVLLSVISMKSRAVREVVSGRYSVIINNGVLDVEEMKNTQLTTDELMEELRQSGALRLEDVRYCILETSGKMSVFLKKDTDAKTLPVMLVSDGSIIKENLKTAGFTKKELNARVEKDFGIRLGDIMLLICNEGKLEGVRKDGKSV